MLDEDDEIKNEVAKFENRMVEHDFESVPLFAGVLTETIFIRKFKMQPGLGLSAYINWYIENNSVRWIVKDALFTIRNFRNVSAHPAGDYETISWLNAVWIVKCVSFVLQEFYVKNSNFVFDESLYLLPTEKVGNPNQVLNNELFNSTNESELLTEKTSIVNWLINKDIFFLIPYYQRNYSWGKGQLNTLIEDIENRLGDMYQHYFGVIAIKEEKFNNSSEHVFYKIIDGQQRLTTTILLCKAAYDYLKNKKFKSIDILDSIFSSQLFNRYRNDSLAGKEKWEFTDILENVIDESKKPESSYGSNYLEFYKYFSSKSEMEVHNFVGTFIHKFKISKLTYYVDSSREMDVFENMNSKGTELDEWDLIKNQLLNIAGTSISDDQKIGIMNDLFLKDILSNQRKKQAEFLEDFCTEFFYYKSLQWVKFDRFPVYNNFKSLLREKLFEINDYQNILKELARFGQIYQCIRIADFSSFDALDFATLTRLSNISKKKQLHFLIFQVFSENAKWDDQKWVITNKENFRNLIAAISNIVLRLEIVKGVGTSWRDDIALSISKIIRENKTEVIDKIKEFLKKSSVYRNDVALEQSLTNSQYTETQLVKTLLLLVNHYILNRKGYIKIEWQDPSIEHVMPQENKKWVSFLKEQDHDNWEVEYEKHLNLIGNFYLLPREINSRISNSTFADKKDYLIKESTTPEILGSKELGITPLAEIDSWTFKLIEQRTAELAKLLLKILEI